MFREIKIANVRDGFVALEAGQNKFRVLGDPITGIEGWDKTDPSKPKPTSVRDDEEYKLDGKVDVAAFWAIPVWNYKLEKVQVLKIKQKTIMNGLQSWENNEEYGDATGYDIVISKEGEGLKTKYSVMANPPKPISKEIEKAFSDTYLNLEAIYEGGNPFDQSSGM